MKKKKKEEGEKRKIGKNWIYRENWRCRVPFRIINYFCSRGKDLDKSFTCKF